ncbi:MAG: hypothetical protein ACOYMN_02845 [Roseimicrobium sp.]
MPHFLKRLLLLATCLLAGHAKAHHGDEFFLLEDYELPAIGSGHVAMGFDWEKYNGLDAFSTECMALVTLAPHTALSIGTSFMDEGEDWRYAATVPRLHVQLTPPSWELPVNISFSVGYQVVDGAAGYGTKRVRVVTYETQYETVTTEPVAECGCQALAVSSGSSTGDPGGGGGGPDCDPSVDVDCLLPAPAKSAKHAGHDHPAAAPAVVATAAPTPSGGGTVQKARVVRRVQYQNVPEAGGHEHKGIHNHVANLWSGRLVIEADLGKTKAILNLIGISPEGLAPAWGYAAGVRHQLTHEFGLGVEAIGDFVKDGMHEVTLGCYVNPNHTLTLKLGAGFGLTQASADFSLKTGVVWRF